MRRILLPRSAAAGDSGGGPLAATESASPYPGGSPAARARDCARVAGRLRRIGRAIVAEERVRQARCRPLFEHDAHPAARRQRRRLHPRFKRHAVGQCERIVVQHCDERVRAVERERIAEPGTCSAPEIVYRRYADEHRRDVAADDRRATRREAGDWRATASDIPRGWSSRLRESAKIPTTNALAVGRCYCTGEMVPPVTSVAAVNTVLLVSWKIVPRASVPK